MSHEPPPFQTDFPRDDFAARRGRVLDAIGRDAVAVLPGAPASGAFDLFRQTNEFYYLCGVETPHAYLLLDGRTRRTTLYLPPRDEKLERSEGPQLNADAPDAVRALTGVDAVGPHARLRDDLANAREVYLPHAPAEGRQACRDTLRHARRQIEADPWDGRPSAEQHFRERVTATCPAAAIHDLSPTLDQLRVIKSARELDLMRRAGRLTALATCEAVRATRPGMIEWQLAAAADCVFATHGARGAGYRAIVAGGANIWNAHYFRNDCPLRSGDLVLYDYAPDCGNYTSDIGRMWPVNGRYTPEQRELYGFVVAYHRALLQVIRPHALVRDMAREAAELIRPQWSAWPWARPAWKEAARKMIESEVAFTHPVGMAVHDVGEYKHEPLLPGLVFALDPQLWVPDERLYIRVEDTVAVTDSGVESLTAAAPLDLDEIERMLAYA